MSNITHYSEHVGANPSKVFKSTMFRSERLMLGLNCLHPGQEQHPHVHDERRTAGEGMVIWAPADVSHGVINTGDGRLVLLVGIAPFPS